MSHQDKKKESNPGYKRQFEPEKNGIFMAFPQVPQKSHRI